MVKRLNLKRVIYDDFSPSVIFYAVNIYTPVNGDLDHLLLPDRIHIIEISSVPAPRP